MLKASATHIVLIPSYNSGAKLFETVLAARQYWDPVWVVIDGSTDESVVMPLAVLNWPLPVPKVPHWVMYVPLGLNF